MRWHVILAVLVAALALGLSLFGGAHRRAALLGAAAASVTAIASLAAMARSARAARKPVQSALLVMVLFFLVRIALVAIGTVLVVRMGENVFAFVAAFFVPYFAFAAIEGAFLHSTRRDPGAAA